MFCRNCGKEVSGNDKFCFYCGAPVMGEPASSETPVQQAPATATEAPVIEAPTADTAPKKAKKKPSVVLIVLGVILLLQLIPVAIVGIVNLVQNKIKEDKFRQAYYCETESLKNADEGDCVEYGSYIQNGNDAEPIIWIVIKENEDGSKVLMSRNVIECMEPDEATAWLLDIDDGFIDEAFSNSEAEDIISVRLPTNSDILDMKTACNYGGIMEFSRSKYASAISGETLFFLFVDNMDGNTIKSCYDCFWTCTVSDGTSYAIRPVIVVG